MLHQKLARFFSSDIGIDLGTANCLVYIRDKGIVLSEPSVVAINKLTHEVLAVGDDAKRMLGRCSVNRLVKPRVLIAVPHDITEVETRAVQDSAGRAGASEVLLIEEPMAAAIGIGLPVAEPVGSMIVDIGGGTTEVAVISLAGIVEPKSVRVGGDDMDKAIENHMKRVYNLAIGPRTAENIKIQIGSAYQESEQEMQMDVMGRDLVSGLPKTIKISSREIRICLQEPVTSIVEAVRSTLERCPPELSGDLIEHGIMLAGGGALLRGLDKLISEEMNLPVFVADQPLNAVVNGTGIVLQEMTARHIMPCANRPDSARFREKIFRHIWKTTRFPAVPF